eukprot:m.52125 g.52125  ORF g.52125 m.52125 type:complete len:562 (+) comp7603_c0_seq1:69-1754(+)
MLAVKNGIVKNVLAKTAWSSSLRKMRIEEGHHHSQSLSCFFGHSYSKHQFNFTYTCDRNWLVKKQHQQQQIRLASGERKVGTPEHEFTQEQFSTGLEQLKTVTEVSTSYAMREQHSHDESFHPSCLPDAVAFPKTSSQVADIVRICFDHNIPIIPFGTGTGLEGGVTAQMGGVSVDMMGMEDIIDVNMEDMTCTVSSSITRKHLNHELLQYGLYFPIDPGADASLCGMCATSATGTTTVMYGALKDNVVNLEVVGNFPESGYIINTNSYLSNNGPLLNGSNFNLTQLFIGSEGTMGIITKATLKLHPLPSIRESFLYAFNTMTDVATAAEKVLANSIRVMRMETMDATIMKCINSYRGTQFDVTKHYLFCEFMGDSQEEIHCQMMEVDSIFKGVGGNMIGTTVSVPGHEELYMEASQLWDARHNAWYAMLSMKKGSFGYTTDVCVPISRFGEIINFTYEKIAELDLFAPIVGHIGDGNFHCMLNMDLSDENEVQRVKSLSSALANKAIELGGTCTGEHGVGVGKKAFLRKELGDVNVNLQRALVHAIGGDLMNPNKVFPNE